MPSILRDAQRRFLEANHTAVMATIDDAGRPHMVPVLVGLVGDELWSSGNEGRVRTAHAGRRPQGAATVLSKEFWGPWLTVSGSLEVRRDDPVEENLRLYRIITGKDPDDLAEYREAMVRERRLIVALRPERAFPAEPTGRG